MRRVTLPGTDIETSALGFGTAALMGRLGKIESLRLLETAYEHGVRHFDTAPLYGLGEAEAVVGDFLKKRPDATVTTKFGLGRPKMASAPLRLAKQLARPIVRSLPFLRATARNVMISTASPATTFTTTAAKLSLETSLKLLRRDSIDIFLLHECRASDLNDDALLHFLSTARERGQIKAFGIGTDIATIRHCADSGSPYGAVLQFVNNINEPNIATYPCLAQKHACITHTPFGGVGNGDSQTARSALSYAAAKNPKGIVLFGSQKTEHVAVNVRSFP